jgi:hypothetical protein
MVTHNDPWWAIMQGLQAAMRLGGWTHGWLAPRSAAAARPRRSNKSVVIAPCATFIRFLARTPRISRCLHARTILIKPQCEYCLVHHAEEHPRGDGLPSGAHPFQTK